MSAKYPNFVYWMPERMGFDETAFANTSNHLRMGPARKLTKRLLSAMRPVLENRSPVQRPQRGTESD